MAKLHIGKIGTELVLFVDTESYEERDIIDRFGRAGEKFDGKIIAPEDWHHPGLELRKEIL